MLILKKNQSNSFYEYDKLGTLNKKKSEVAVLNLNKFNASFDF